MTVLLVLLVTASVLWVAFALLSRRGNQDPVQTVDGFLRALEALAPDEEGELSRRRGRRRQRS